MPEMPAARRAAQPLIASPHHRPCSPTGSAVRGGPLPQGREAAGSRAGQRGARRARTMTVLFRGSVSLLKVAVVGCPRPSDAQLVYCSRVVRQILDAGHEIVTLDMPTGINCRVVRAAQAHGHADQVTLVQPWESGNWQDGRLKYRVPDPDLDVAWNRILVALHPTECSGGKTKVLLAQIGTVMVADLLVVIPDQYGTATLFMTQVASARKRRVYIVRDEESTLRVLDSFTAA